MGVKFLKLSLLCRLVEITDLDIAFEDGDDLEHYLAAEFEENVSIRLGNLNMENGIIFVGYNFHGGTSFEFPAVI